MKINVKRLHKTNNSTIGELYIDGKFECYTLEDVERDKKIDGKTAIPKGTYKVIINHSNRFNRLLPLLLDVPNYTGVRIHSGNTAQDTEGCILVGKKRGIDVLYDSRLAFSQLFEKMLFEKKSITITIE